VIVALVIWLVTLIVLASLEASQDNEHPYRRH
jgi:hypothetical protein